jgi:hypothetical protein
MKLNKLFLGLLGVAALTLGACSDDDKYEWATVSGPQVYFSDQLSTHYEIDPEGTSFNVPISRADASGSLTVNLTSETAGTMYSIPSSVTFDAGQTEADILVSYDPANIEYGRYDTLTVKIADNAQATQWGTQEFSFIAGVTDWGPWQKWNSAGTATYTYVNFWEGDDAGLPFVYRHNMIKTNLYQFRLSNWGYGVDIVFDYDENTGYVTCAKQWTGYTHATYGDVYAIDENAYKDDGVYGSFDKEQGIITIPLAYVVDAGTFGYDPEYIYIDGYVRADYTIGFMTYQGIFTNLAGNTFAVGYVEAGADVTEMSAVVVDVDADADAVADAIAAGDLEATVIPSEQFTQFLVPIAEDQTGKLQIVTAVIVDGEVKSVAASPFEYYGGGGTPWESIGIGYYTEDFICSLFTSFEPVTYEVEIEENKDMPGLYRMVSPYGPAFPYYDESKFDHNAVYNIEVNATDPEGVYIPLQPTGTDWGYGPMSIMSWGAYYLNMYDFERVKAANPPLLGTLVDGVITFPSEPVSEGSEDHFQGLIYLGEKAYYAGVHGLVQIVLPGASAGARAKAKSQVKASDFARRLNHIDLEKHKVTKLVRALVPNK